MVRSGDPKREEIWGTWEELLLACAVSRHGIGSWDSVAMEIRSRIHPTDTLTPHSCRQRYRDLQRRFASTIDGGAAINGSREDDEEADSPPEVSWVEELRKLRVAELRRELENRDLSIGSLQLKLKRLQEEREKETQSGGGKPDQAKEESPSSASSPETVADNRISGRDSGPSCGESNSTDPKQEGKPGNEDDRKAEEAARTGDEASDPSAGRGEKAAAAAAGEVSCNGSTEGATDQASQPQMGESGESIAESKGGELGREAEREEKESSDVQSSVSLSRRRRRLRKKAVSGGGSSSDGEEPEAEEVSIASGAECRPLISFLEIIRLDKHGSVFERRLESQDTARYRGLIRRHVDLDMVRAELLRIGSSGGSYATAEFFRDLLLLCANAIVFYPKDSPESIAAVHLRELVSKEMASTLRSPSPQPLQPPQTMTQTTTTTTTTEIAPQPPAAQPQPTASKPKSEPDLTGTLLAKSTPSAPLIACRKRSSISNKAATTAAKEKDDKSESDRQDRDNEEKSLVKKKATKEKSSVSGTTRGLRTNKSRSSVGNAGATKRPNVAPTPSLKSKPPENTATGETSGKADKKGNGGGSGVATPAASSTKKQSAASFLNRMKRSSNGTLMETVKVSPAGGGKGAEQKKFAKGDGRKDPGSRQGSGGPTKKVEDTSGSGKRSVGRPPKRTAPPPTPPPAKRAREEADAGASRTPSSSATRKRGRK